MPSRDRTAGTLTALRMDRVELPAVTVTVTPPGGAALRCELGIAPIVIGTDADCDLTLDDPRVSRRHCQIALGDRGIVVRDLGSKNGTTCGGVTILEAVIAAGTEIALGGSRLVATVTGQRSVPLSRAARFGDAIGSSVVMRALFDRLARVAPTGETVLLVGESGTGKEVLARAVHDHSARKDGAFVVLDCSAVAPNLVESELFGHEKGAFTDAGSGRVGLLERAGGGTLFIDEIGELPFDLQPKLLRALESRTVRRLGANDYRPFDARIIAATHRDLRARIAEGAFRADLYYRLAVVEARVPPLRERLDDLALLAERFLAAQVPPRTWDDLPPNCLEILTAYDWPGNARELRNIIARLVLFQGDALGALRPQTATPGSSGGRLAELARLPLREARDAVVEQFERAYIAIKLAETSGNVSRAAEAIGVSRQFLHRLIERYGLRGDHG